MSQSCSDKLAYTINMILSIGVMNKSVENKTVKNNKKLLKVSRDKNKPTFDYYKVSLTSTFAKIVALVHLSETFLLNFEMFFL